MFETSQDILNLVKAVSIAAIVIFACLAIYYLARILEQGFKIIKEMRERLYKIDDLVKSVKNKIEHSASYLSLIGDGMKKLVEVVKEHTTEEKKKTRKKK